MINIIKEVIKIGLCVKCRKLYAPNFMIPLEDDDQMCVFCSSGKNTINYTEDGSSKSYSQKEAVKDYKKFLRMLKEKPEIARKLAEAGAKSMGNTLKES